MKITELEAMAIGFEHVKRYPHDEWFTNRYKKGALILEFTYRVVDKKLETIDLTIDEVVGLEVSGRDLKHLDRIINR